MITTQGMHRDSLRQALMYEGFDVIFTAELGSAKEIINETKPVALIHDFNVSDLSQSKQFQLSLSRVAIDWDMPRIVLLEAITPSAAAFANDAQITKIMARGSSVLAIATELGMVVSANNNLSQIQRDIRNMRLNSTEELSQEEIDSKIRAAFEQYPHDPEVKIEYANLCLRSEDLSTAKELSEDLIASGKENVRAMNLLARCYMKSGDSESAVKILEKADMLSPHNTDRLIEMGEVFYNQGNLGKAKKCFNSALAIDSTNTKATKSLGMVHISEGDATAAIELFNGNIPEEESAGVFNNAAVHAVSQGELEKALKLYEAAFKCLKPKSTNRRCYSM